MTIDELLEDKGFNETCSDCAFYKEWEECHPYGMTTACETMAECLCDVEDMCPRLQEG